MTDDKRAGLVREIDALLREDHGTTDATVLLRVARDQIASDGQLEAALRKYGHHLPLCAAWDAGTWRGSDAAICNCGLAQSLAAAGGEDQRGCASDSHAEGDANASGQAGVTSVPAPPTTTTPGERQPDPSMVICPACAHQFRAIPQDVQAALKEAQDKVRDADNAAAFYVRDMPDITARRAIELLALERANALARAARCEQDAARWRWFCENDGLPDGWVFEQMHSDEQRDHIPKAEYDAAIDAALASAGQPKP